MVLVAAIALGSAVSAQATVQLAVPCDGKRISSIAIEARAPSFLSVPRQLRALARGAGLLHTTTKPRVIAGLLRLAVGKLCTERERSESERILRLQPFIAGATVRAVPDTAGMVRIEVETIDEIPSVFAMHLRGARPTAVRFGNGNVGGQGLLVATSVEHRRGYRTGFGIQSSAYAAFGGPYTLALDAQRAPLGGAFSLALGYPFLTALQRTAWHVGFSNARRYDAYNRAVGDALSLGVDRGFWDVGGVHRVRVGRHGAFVGLLLSHESVTPARHAVIASDSGVVSDTTQLLGRAIPAYKNTRVNGVYGARHLTFVPVRGFDALDAVQDVASGAQVGVLAGHGIAWLGGGDDDYLVSTEAYLGRGSPVSFTAVRLEVEGRYDRHTGDWDSAIGSGRLAWYVKPASSHVLISSVEFGAGSRTRLPFQLALGDLVGGLRGYHDSRAVGAVRAVARIEERWTLAAKGQRVAVGLASFVDAGRVWAGDAPFGVNSSIKTAVGAGLLVAVPRQSPRLFRLDVAVPLNADGRAHWEVRLSSVYTRAFWREPRDVARGRAGAAPSTIFTWP
jgi:hypothetical protein